MTILFHCSCHSLNSLPQGLIKPFDMGQSLLFGDTLLGKSTQMADTEGKVVGKFLQ